MQLVAHKLFITCSKGHTFKQSLTPNCLQRQQLGFSIQRLSSIIKSCVTENKLTKCEQYERKLHSVSFFFFLICARKAVRLSFGPDASMEWRADLLAYKWQGTGFVAPQGELLNKEVQLSFTESSPFYRQVPKSAPGFQHDTTVSSLQNTLQYLIPAGLCFKTRTKDNVTVTK